MRMMRLGLLRQPGSIADLAAAAGGYGWPPRAAFVCLERPRFWCTTTKAKPDSLAQSYGWLDLTHDSARVRAVGHLATTCSPLRPVLSAPRQPLYKHRSHSTSGCRHNEMMFLPQPPSTCTHLPPPPLVVEATAVWPPPPSGGPAAEAAPAVSNGAASTPPALSRACFRFSLLPSRLLPLLFLSSLAGDRVSLDRLLLSSEVCSRSGGVPCTRLRTYRAPSWQRPASSSHECQCGCTLSIP